MKERRTKTKQTVKRPAVNPPMPDQSLEEIINDFNNIKRKLENHAVHLRALDRKRLNGVGIKTQGFIDRAFEYAVSNTEYLPHWLSIEKFREDYAAFIAFQTLIDTGKQILEILWNGGIKSADMVYTDALEFYAMVREAAKRRVDAAETMYKDLVTFFKKHKITGDSGNAAPTEKELKRDMNALLHGKKDGRIVIENVKPKVSGGRHKIIDEKFAANGQFRESEEGEMRE